MTRPSRHTFAPFIEHWHGAATRVGVSETAFVHRKHPFNFIIWFHMGKSVRLGQKYRMDSQTMAGHATASRFGFVFKLRF
jgi:hypothetical protein